MIREKIIGSGFGKETGFRWRGGDISRMEGFSDNVFGFALTLLVVSLEVPRTFADLQQTLYGFTGFAFAFALLFLFWYEHYKYFRRYGLEGNTVLWLNAVLLFVILFFVYPLKFLITFLSKLFSGASLSVLNADGSKTWIITPDQMVTLMTVYGIGFIVIYGIMTLLYIHAYSRRIELELDATEMIITKGSIIAHAANCGIALTSISIVQLGGPGFAGMSGFAYCLIGPIQGVLGFVNGRKVHAILNSPSAGGH
jgi:uncharacterized membrane protein